jgi:RimJ/RimL family protein N-acetyltransferase
VNETVSPFFDVETQRLRLRSLGPDDEALFRELYTDAETMRFIAPPLSTGRAAKSFKRIILRQSEHSLNGRFLAILEKDTLESVGICGTSQYDADALRVEVGIVLGARGRARGFGREALTALMRKIFAEWPLDEVWVQCSTEYPAVERMVLSIGFTPCSEIAEEKVSLSRRVWSVRRSSWYVDQAAN